MSDYPTTTTGTPDAARVMEQAAMRLYRDAHPNGPLWQELSDQTRIMWVAYAEKGAKHSLQVHKLTAIELSDEFVNFVQSCERDTNYTNDEIRAKFTENRAARGGAA